MKAKIQNNIKRYLLTICLSALIAISINGCGQKSITVTEKTEPVETIDYSDIVKMTEVSETEIQELTTEVVSEEAAQPEEVSLIMVGDILLHTRVHDSGLMEDGSYNYDHMFANLKDDISAADFALVNQEVILGGRELKLSGYPAFNGAYEVGDSLVEAGFDVILHATNHAVDKGKKGILNCVNFWRDSYPDIKVVGVYDSQEAADELCVVEKDGIKIAILNYTYGTNGIELPADMPYAVNLWNKDKIAMDVKRAKEQADFVVVCPHWGTEYVLDATNEQKKKARFLADLGVDLILGTHPHVIEPVEWIKGEGGNDTLVYYSIGNYINATSGTGEGAAARMVGAMAMVSIKKNEEGNAVIASYGVEPLVTHLREGRGLITTYKLSDYTEELAAQNEMIKQDSAFSLEYCKKLCQQVFGELYGQE